MAWRKTTPTDGRATARRYVPNRPYLTRRCNIGRIRPVIGTLLKAQVEVQGLSAGDGVQQGLEGSRWPVAERGTRPASEEEQRCSVRQGSSQPCTCRRALGQEGGLEEAVGVRDQAASGGESAA